MDNDLKSRLDNLEDMVNENNKILKKLYRAHIWRQIWNIVRLVIFVVISFGLYYYADNYIKEIKNFYLNITGNNLNSLNDFSNYILQGKEFMDKIGGVK